MPSTSNVTQPTQTSNVIAALASFFIPGLGQLVQGRVMAAVAFFVATGVGYALYFLIVPLIIAALVHLWCIVDAAKYRG